MMEFILATEQIVRKVQLTPQRIIPTYFPIEIFQGIGICISQDKADMVSL